MANIRNIKEAHTAHCELHTTPFLLLSRLVGGRGLEPLPLACKAILLKEEAACLFQENRFVVSARIRFEIVATAT